MTRYKLLIVMHMFFFTALMCGVVKAQNYDFSKIEAINDYSDELSWDDFVSQTELLQEPSERDRHLAFEMRLPSGWNRALTSQTGLFTDDTEDSNKVSTASQEQLLGEVVRYLSDHKSYYVSRFHVDATSLQGDVTAKNWFINYILERGYNMIGLNVISEAEVEALYFVVERDVSFVVRTKARINGRRMVLSSYYLPEVRWKEERAFQQHVVNSFQFTNPENVKITTTKNYDYLALVSFDYPAAWKLLPPEDFSVDFMEATVFKTKDGVNNSGEINIRVISKLLDTDIKNEIKLLLSDLDSGKKLKPVRLMEKIDTFTMKPYIKYSRIDVYSVAPVKGNKTQLSDYEYWLAVMVDDDYYYLVSMLTPERKSDFFTWAKNTEAFEIVVESIQI